MTARHGAHVLRRRGELVWALWTEASPRVFHTRSSASGTSGAPPAPGSQPPGPMPGRPPGGMPPIRPGGTAPQGDADA